MALQPGFADIRDERPDDAAAIAALTTAAFRDAPHASGTEAQIVDALRADNALTLSLVAIENNIIVGHAVFSPVTITASAIGSTTGGWFGLGPVSVRPDRQRSGIGSALIEAGLQRLKECGARGCVVLGDPAYYARFGFVSDPALRYAELPPEYFRRIVFKGTPPHGTVTYHSAFDAA